MLCLTIPIGLSAIAPFYYLQGVGKTQWDAASSVLTGAIVGGVGLVLIPRLGLVGVGYGLLAAVLVRWVVMALVWSAHFRGDVGLGTFAVHLWAPPVVSTLTLGALVRLHDALQPPRRWPWFAVGLLVATGLSALLHAVALELMPGGPARRRDVVASVRAALRR